MPFTLGDVQLVIGCRRLSLATSTDAVLDQARSTSLTFTTQKKGVENKVICMGLSGDPYRCCVKAVKQRICHLRAHNAPLDIPLALVYAGVGEQV